MTKSFIKKIIEREGSVYTTKNYCYFRHIIEDYDQDGNYLGFHYLSIDCISTLQELVCLTMICLKMFSKETFKK